MPKSYTLKNPSSSRLATLAKFSLPALLVGALSVSLPATASTTTANSTTGNAVTATAAQTDVLTDAQKAAQEKAKAEALAKKATIHKINAIQRDLTSIRQQALKQHPELVKQAKALETTYKQKAEEIGYNPDAFVAKAEALQKELRKTNMPEEERNKLVKEFAAAKQQLAHQRQVLISDPTLVSLQKSLQQDTIAAMKASDPKTEALLTELQQLIDSVR
ncbi:hypothetical protein ACFFLZ_23075 [Photobacterium aphoticum]|uniref:hypothetical protein n=1 Tax=Photobacterium aphoticum TaxID=754436 RepID=UPI00069FD8CF|nr:hypothetical protein [Photobacterium aphoticum]PSU58130.1 hypothetical protein C9I90_07550 [Photobacterium aphoticum]GHA36175.1 hypothetical protein GCM10007086_06700 [Photobacterium aphoticum]